MNDEPRPTHETADRAPRSYGAAWVVSLMAVPVLYFAGMPPLLVCLEARYGYGIFLTPPRWLSLLMLPWGWVEANTPLGDPMRAYVRWWFTGIINPPPSS